MSRQASPSGNLNQPSPEEPGPHDPIISTVPQQSSLSFHNDGTSSFQASLFSLAPADPTNSRISWDCSTLDSPCPNIQIAPRLTEYSHIGAPLDQYQGPLLEDYAGHTTVNSTDDYPPNNFVTNALLDSLISTPQVASTSSQHASGSQSDNYETLSNTISQSPISQSYSGTSTYYIDPLAIPLVRGYYSGSEAYSTPETAPPHSAPGSAYSDSDHSDGYSTSSYTVCHQEIHSSNGFYAQSIQPESPPGYVDPQFHMPFPINPHIHQDTFTMQLMRTLHTNGYVSAQIAPAEYNSSKRHIGEEDGAQEEYHAPHKRARTDNPVAISLTYDTTTSNAVAGPSSREEENEDQPDSESLNDRIPWKLKGKGRAVPSETTSSNSQFKELDYNEGCSKPKMNRQKPRAPSTRTRKRNIPENGFEPQLQPERALEHPLPQMEPKWCSEVTQTGVEFTEISATLAGREFVLDHSDMRTWGVLSRPVGLGTACEIEGITRSNDFLGTMGEFICLICKRHFDLSCKSAARAMERHIITHGKYEKLPCPAKGCEVVFTRPDVIRRHIKNPNNHHCFEQVANKDVKSSIDLEEHQWKALLRWCIERLDGKNMAKKAKSTKK